MRDEGRPLRGDGVLGVKDGLGNGLLRAVHHSVRGRTRLEVPGLYRAPVIKRKVEAGLHSVAGVRRAQANVLTGRMLVLYDPKAIGFDEILELIVELVSQPRAASNESERRGRRSRGGPSPKLLGRLNGLASLLRGLWSAGPGDLAFAGAPFASSGGAHTTSGTFQAEASPVWRQ